MTYGEEVRERVERMLAIPMPGGGPPVLTRFGRLVAAMAGSAAEEWRDGEATAEVDLHLAEAAGRVPVDAEWEAALGLALLILDVDCERPPEDGDVLGRWPLYTRQNG